MVLVEEDALGREPQMRSVTHRDAQVRDILYAISNDKLINSFELDIFNGYSSRVQKVHLNRLLSPFKVKVMVEVQQ